MAVSEAKKRANLKWNQANKDRYWRATIIFPAEEKATIMAKAERAGMSLSDYIRGLIERDDGNQDIIE